MIGCISDDYFIAYINKEGKFIYIQKHGDFNFAVKIKKLYQHGLAVLGIQGLCLLNEFNRLAAQKETAIFQFQFQFSNNVKIHCRLIKVKPPGRYWESRGAIVKSKIHRLTYRNDIGN